MTTTAITGANDFAKIKERSIDQCDRPASITRKEAEKICRGVIKDQPGDIPNNLFKDSVDQLMEEINGSEVTE